MNPHYKTDDMKHDYYQVDENGRIIEVYTFRDGDKDIPSNCFKGWGDRVIHNPIWSFELNDWIDGGDPIDILEDYKKSKAEELSKACQQSIYNGFEYEINGVTYHFSYDTEAQLNFQGVERLFAQGIVEEVMWTVKKDGQYMRIPITKEILDELALVMLNHKNANISKYRDVLMPMVESAQTIEEVEAITWDSVSIDSIENQY
jgi:hypothetical protein